MSLPAQGSPSPLDTDRLNGWKEIASFLDKGVRTAQRWERDFGLPVHRLGANGGEIVFASRSEISAWMQTADHSRAAIGAGTGDVAETVGPARGEPAAPTRAGRVPGRTHRASTSVTRWLVVVSVGAVVLAYPWFRDRSAAGRQPATWRVQDDQLTVVGEGGRVLWSFRPGPRLSQQGYQLYNDARDVLRPTPVIIEDLEGDGSREVIFPVLVSDGRRPVVYLFNRDGTVRFAYQAPAESLRFGDNTYPADWTLEGTWTTADSNGQRSIWVPYRHRPYFPSLLVQLDPHGRVLSQYVSNGYVVSVSATRWKGTDVVLVGAANNETRGGSLAIFESRTVRGSAPAEDRRYRCTNCPPGGPDTFLTFPRACLSLGPGETSRVGRAWIGGEDTVWAEVHHGWFFQRPDEVAAGPVVYSLDRDLTPVRVEIGANFTLLHRQQLEARGLTDHQVGPVDQAMVMPVRRWNGDRFEDLPRVAVEIDR